MECRIDSKDGEWVELQRAVDGAVLIRSNDKSTRSGDGQIQIRGGKGR